MKKQALWARLALFTAALIWGSSFFIMKNSTEVFPTFILLGLRFTIGFMVLGAIFLKRFKRATQKTLLKGIILGLLLFIAYSVQTLGLIRTTPGKNAFLTAVYCVLVPFITWLVSRKRPDGYNWAAALMCLCGIGLVSLDGDLTMGLGDGLTLLGGLFYALHLVGVAHFSQDEDPAVLTVIQFGAAGVFAWIVALFTESWPNPIGQAGWMGLGYLALFATAGALLLQNVGQKYTPPTSAAILLSLESVFGVLFSVIFYGETVTLKLALGFALIFAAVTVSETKLGFLKKKTGAQSHSL